MKLVTFQTKKAVETLKHKGMLCADVKYIDLQKYALPYDWIIREMKSKHIVPKNGEKYPIWAWAKCGAFTAPRKRKNCSGIKQDKVKIIFEKPDDEVLLSDYMAYSFWLNGQIVPKTKEEYLKFLQTMRCKGIDLEGLKDFVRGKKTSPEIIKIMPKIQQTWRRIFDLKSEVYQACVWNIKMSEVKAIELLDDPKYVYGSMNAKRSNGSRQNWRRRYLHFLPD